MVRIFNVREGMSEQTLQKSLFDGRMSEAQTEAAMLTLKAFNPQLDFKKLKRGAVVMVPDGPAFKASATQQDDIVPITGFVAMARKGLAAASKEMQQAMKERAAERENLAAILQSESFKALKELAEPTGASMKLMSQEAEQDQSDQKSLATAMKSAETALGELAKLFAK